MNIEPELLEYESIRKLIEHCDKLEDQVYTFRKKSDNEEKLKHLMSDILTGLSLTIKQREDNIRWPKDVDAVDFEKSLLELNNYIKKYIYNERVNIGNY